MSQKTENRVTYTDSISCLQRFQEYFLEAKKSEGHLVLLDLLKKAQENAHDTSVSFFQM